MEPTGRKRQFPVEDLDTPVKRPRQDRSRSEEPPSKGPCKRSRSLSPLGGHARSVEHEDREMSDKSPGRKRRRLDKKGAPAEDQKDPAGGATIVSPPAQPVEIDDSADSYEKEGEVVSARRINPSQRTGVRQHNYEVYDLTSAGGEPSPYAHGNGANEKDADKSQDLQKKRTPWGAAARYKSQHNSLPDFSPPTDHQAVHIKPPRGAMPTKAPFAGGPRPVNRLAGNSNQPSGPQQKRPPPTEFHGNSYRRAEDNPQKKQKVGGQSATAQPEIIDVDADSTHGQNNSEPSLGKSGPSHTQHNHATNPRKGESVVQEYRNVENMVNPSQGHDLNRKNRKTGGGSSDNQPAKPRGSGRFLSTDGSKPATVVRLGDDPNDPISDADAPPAEVDSKPVPQVILKAYDGPKSLQPQTSKHSEADDTELKHGAESSNSAQESMPPTPRLGVAGQKRGGLHQSETGPRKIRAIDPEDSVDDLDSEQYNKHPQIMRGRRDRFKTRNPRAGTEAARAHPVDDTSEDDLGKADIKPTEFSSSKKQAPQKQKKLGEREYTIMQVLSPNHLWCVGFRAGHCSLTHDRDNCLLKVEGEKVPSMTMTMNSISTIEFCESMTMMIIHKSRDNSFGGAALICLQLKTQNDCDALATELGASSTITLSEKPAMHITKVFTTTQKTAVEHSKRASAKGQPDDVPPAMKRTQTKLDNALEAKNPRGARIIDQMAQAGSESSGTTQDKRTQSLAGASTKEAGASTREEPTAESSKNKKITAGEFYGGSSSAQLGDNSHETRSSTRLAGKAPQTPPILRRLSSKGSPSPERWTFRNPSWRHSWKSSIVYPRQGKNKATVDMQDIGRLDEGQFLNDNLIEFYIRWLEHNLVKANPDLSKRVYFLNTFFYERLTTSSKGKRGINYDAVKRWTSRVDLPSYDYIVVPVNEQHHWYVAIICNAPKLLPQSPEVAAQSQEKQDGTGKAKPEPTEEDKKKTSSSPSSSPPGTHPNSDVDLPLKDISLQDKSPKNGEDEWPDRDPAPIPPKKSTTEKPAETAEPAIVVSDIAEAPAQKASPVRKGKKKSNAPTPRKYNPEEPRIITLDSLGLKHSPTCTNLKEYLIAEIKSKRGVDIPPPGALGMTAMNIPEQDNYCDCGLFLLSYVEAFLERPDEFIHNILQNENDTEMQWPKASDMRIKIRNILFDLQKEQVAELEKAQELKSKDKKKAKESGVAELAKPTQPCEPSKSPSSSATPGSSAPEAAHTESPSEKTSREQSVQTPGENGTQRKLSTAISDTSGHSPGEQLAQPEANRPSVTTSTKSSPAVKDLDDVVYNLDKISGNTAKEDPSSEMLLENDYKVQRSRPSPPAGADTLLPSIEQDPKHKARLLSPTPIEEEAPSRAVRDRKQTPYISSPGTEKSETPHKDSPKGADDEMLLPNKPAPLKSVPETPSPGFLSDPLGPTSEDYRTLLATPSPRRMRKERSDVQHQYLDAADEAIIKGKGKMKNTHIHFDQ